MLRSFVALACVLLALVAAPQGGIGDALAQAFGVDACGGPDCCCSAERAGNCCAADAGQPRLVSGCRCGHRDDGTPNGAPQMPRLAPSLATRLPDLNFTNLSIGPVARVPTRAPLAPEPPPPRDRD